MVSSTGSADSVNQPVSLTETRRRRATWPILTLAVLFLSASFLTWYYTWFGRDLTDEEITRYLVDEKHPRHVQHALLQVESRLEQGKPAQQWYPRVVALTSSSETEFRMTAAWVMGFDSQSPDFHQALLKLLADSEPMVRRNAALALVKFNDDSGRPELLATLRPTVVKADANGLVNSTLSQGSAISRGALLGRVIEENGAVIEVRSPIPGKIEKVAVGNGQAIKRGETILTLNSDIPSVWEALRGLAFIGKSEDLGEIERYAQGVESLPDRIKQQAAVTAKAIQTRAIQPALKG